jgi:4-hydroxybutyryl-CoA dehydratase/vinylacetyl-CoA-Delta-isomerase
MGLRSAEEFLEGLRDAREVYFQGEPVTDVVDHPELGRAVRHAALDFSLAEDPGLSSLAIAGDDEGEYSAYFRVPRSGEDLLMRSRLIEAGTRLGGTLVLLVKEIGTDALFGLMRVLARHGETESLARVHAFHREARDHDWALAVAQTDVKGDRSKRPSDQADPDLYLRVVKSNRDGIVVRGAKIHTSCSPYVDRLIVLPGRSMTPEDEQWSMAFAVPVATPGLRLYASDFLSGANDAFTHPVSSKHRMIETLTVFDDVFVPWEQVFFHGRPDLAGATALGFVEYHRFTAVSYKLPLLDALVGSAFGIAEANGIARASHVRDKLCWLAGYVETVRSLKELAALRASHEGDLAYPDVFTTNLAKWVFARDFHRALETVQDLSGGLLVTRPSGADWESDLVHPVLDKYLVGAWEAQARLSLMNLISDLTSSAYGGYQAVLAIHAEGSLEAEKMGMLRAYDPEPAVAYALGLAGSPAAGVENKNQFGAAATRRG